ncbi:hypothetical protein ACF059_31370 [Streptomyces sp. NPDC016562]|uniref:hypothetical protein n=1 Tax=Streptomyces sp. NPDC016562 TaxID=3364966 RepID=UPI003700107E
MAYEQKFDGHRMLVFTPSEPGGRVLLQTRRGSLVLGAVAGGLFSVSQARHTGGAAMKVDELKRAAEWQVHRRQKYAALLTAVQRVDADDLDVGTALSEALLVANKPLRDKLLSFEGPKELRGQLKDRTKYAELVEVMTADVRNRTDS